ncbi:MAG: Uma2 family endonuclease [Armatimonadota bacterium]
MAVVVPKKSYTIDDLWDLSHRTGKRYELVRGELRELTPTGWEHGRICARLARLLDVYASEQGVGVVLGAETGCVLQTEPTPTVRAADVAFVRRDRLPEGMVPQQFGAVVPDLVVEVVSPSDRYAGLVEKISDWLSAGVQMVWVVDPTDRLVIVHRAGQPVRILNENDTLSGEEVLHGFECKVSEIFAL